MTTATHATRLLQEFGARIGLPEVHFGDDDFCTLSFDDLILNLEHRAADDSLTGYIWLCAVPAERRAEAALQIADANYLLVATAGATLGMNRLTGDVALSQRLPTGDLDLPGLERAFTILLNLADRWRQRLTAEPVAAPAAAPLDITALRV
jgi:hypothetical protein